MKTELYFSVESDFITKFARERYKETNDLSVGVTFLTKALIGFPVDLATSIVLGNKKLVGVNSVTVEDDNEEVIPYKVIKTMEIKDAECGWIAPDGSVFGHRSYNNTNDHLILAEKICERYEWESVNEEFTLEDNGFLKLDPYKVLACRSATEAQKSAVAKYCREHRRRIQIGYYCKNLYSGMEIDKMDLQMFNKHLFVKI